MKSLIILLIVLFLVLQYKLWFGRGGFSEAVHLRHELTRQQQKNAKSKQRNAILSADIGALKSGLGAIESRARTELGMVKKGEVFYQVVH